MEKIRGIIFSIVTATLAVFSVMPVHATQLISAVTINGTIINATTVSATTLSGAYSGTINAANISAGTFGSNTGGGNFTFPAYSIVQNGNAYQLNAVNNNGYFAINNPSTYWGLVGNYGLNDWRIGYGTTLALANSSAWNLKWDTSGNVVVNTGLGVGIAGNPTYKLDVAGDINFTGILRQNGSPYVGSQWTTSGNNIYYNTGSVSIGATAPVGGASLYVNGYARVEGNLDVMGSNGLYTLGRISSVGAGTNYIMGNLGVGTASPGAQLEVNGNVIVNPSSAAWAEGIQFKMPSVSTWGGLRWSRARGNYDGNWYVGYTALDTSDDLVFGAGNGGGQVDNIIRLTKAGNVGIRNGSPSYTLDISGNQRVASGDNSYTYYGPNSSWSGSLYVGATPGKMGTNTAHVVATDGNLHLDSGNNGKAVYIQYYSGTNTYINPNGGYVGIGTTSPGYKLEVVGNAVIRGDIYCQSCSGPGWMTSYLNQAVRSDSNPTFNDVYSNSWLRNNNNGQGLYNQNQGMHFYALNGNWNIGGAGTYPKLIFRDTYESTIRGYVYSDGTGFGMLNNNGSWMFYSPSGSTNVYFPAWGNWISSATTAGGSNTWTGLQYFQSNNGPTSGSLYNPPLMVYSTGNNSAFMSFHKGGYYAVNFGLDSDNVLRIGGWSASANRWQLDMSGNETLAGGSYAAAFYYNSDISLKKDVQTLTGSLDNIMKLRGVSFTWKDSGQQSVGLIAQEVEKVYPQLVKSNDNNNGIKTLEYGNLVAPLIEAVKELNSVVIKVENGIAKVKELIAEKITAKKVITDSLEMKDRITGDVYCVTIAKGDLMKTKGACR